MARVGLQRHRKKKSHLSHACFFTSHPPVPTPLHHATNTRYVAPRCAIFSPLPLSLLQPDIFQAPLLKPKQRQSRRCTRNDRLAAKSRNRVSIPGNNTYFSPLKTVQSIFGIYPASYSAGTWSPNPWREADLSPSASIESKKIPSYISTPTYVFMPCTVTCLPLHVPK